MESARRSSASPQTEIGALVRGSWLPFDADGACMLSFIGRLYDRTKHEMVWTNLR